MYIIHIKINCHTKLTFMLGQELLSFYTGQTQRDNVTCKLRQHRLKFSAGGYESCQRLGDPVRLTGHWNPVTN